MKIQLLECNTVAANYDDGVNENVNSCHAEKALTPLTEALAKAFTYKGVYNTGDDSDTTLSFNSESCKVGNIDPLEPLPVDERVKKFCEIVFTEEVKTAFIEKLPQVPVTTKQQRVVRVTEDAKDAVERTISIPDGEEQIIFVEGVATYKKIYEKKIWVAPLFNEDGSKTMQSVQVIADGEPVFEFYHKKTDKRYPI